MSRPPLEVADLIRLKDELFVDTKGPAEIKNRQCSVKLADGILTLSAATELKLCCGDAIISIKSDGTIDITGPQKVTACGGKAGHLELAGTGATVSGPSATVSAKGMTEITGGIVKIN